VSIATPTLWAVSLALVLLLVAADFAVTRRPHEVSLREATGWSLFYLALPLAFGGWVWWQHGPRPGSEFLTGYVVEKSLSVDNLFVFLALFTYFAVPAENQHRVLFWGIVGAIVTRGAFIFAGVALLHAVAWLAYVLGAILVATGLKLAFTRGEEVHPDRNLLVRWARRALPLTSGYRGERFVLREGGRLLFTPLVVVLLAVESTDVMFAVDSVPAVLAITPDAFVAYTSNIFAVLGLRALYFLLAGAIEKLRYLRPALALVLVLLGIEMALAEGGVLRLSTGASLAGVAGILGAAVLASLLRPERVAADREPTG
jgi:tellurite resistance protein TerC